MLLEIGATVRDNVPDHALKREAVSLRDARMAETAAAVGGGLRDGEPHRAEQQGERRAGFDQLLPTHGDAGVPDWFLQ